MACNMFLERPFSEDTILDFFKVCLRKKKGEEMKSIMEETVIPHHVVYTSMCEDYCLVPSSILAHVIEFGYGTKDIIQLLTLRSLSCRYGENMILETIHKEEGDSLWIKADTKEDLYKEALKGLLSVWNEFDQSSLLWKYCLNLIVRLDHYPDIEIEENMSLLEDKFRSRWVYYDNCKYFSPKQTLIHEIIRAIYKIDKDPGSLKELYSFFIMAWFRGVSPSSILIPLVARRDAFCFKSLSKDIACAKIKKERVGFVNSEKGPIKRIPWWVFFFFRSRTKQF